MTIVIPLFDIYQCPVIRVAIFASADHSVPQESAGGLVSFTSDLHLFTKVLSVEIMAGHIFEAHKTGQL